MRKRKHVKPIHCMSNAQCQMFKFKKKWKKFNTKIKSRDAMTFLHSWYLWTDVSLSLFWGPFVDLQMTPAQCEKKRHVLFPTQCIWIPSVSSQAQVNHFTCVFLSSQEQESALTKLNSFHNWQAMCLVLIEPHFHLLKWKAHGKRRAPGSDQLLSYWATPKHTQTPRARRPKREIPQSFLRGTNWMLVLLII